MNILTAAWTQWHAAAARRGPPSCRNAVQRTWSWLTFAGALWPPHQSLRPPGVQSSFASRHKDDVRSPCPCEGASTVPPRRALTTDHSQIIKLLCPFLIDNVRCSRFGDLCGTLRSCKRICKQPHRVQSKCLLHAVPLRDCLGHFRRAADQGPRAWQGESGQLQAETFMKLAQMHCLVHRDMLDDGMILCSQGNV